jgi:tetratricopeptide (TPR) repeat protein
MTRVYPTLIVLFIISFSLLNGQINPLLEAETEKKMTEAEQKLLHLADKHIDDRLYLEAGRILDSLSQIYPEDEYLSYLTGLSLSYNPNKSAESLRLIQNAIGIQEFLPNYDYHLAYALEQNGKYDEAIKYYELFLEKKPPSEVRQEIKHRIEYCKMYMDLLSKPAAVKISSAGKTLNTAASEYFPCLPSDESFMVFTYAGEKSKGGKQANAKNLTGTTGYAEDIYISYRDNNGKWSAPSPIESLNTTNSEACVSVSHDGSRMFLHLNDAAGKGDLYESTLEGNKWLAPVRLKGINSPESEGGASLTPDEKHLIFSSDRAGGLGGKDLWIAELLMDGSWGNVKTLGERINTSADEDFPFVTADGKTLFFSSNNPASSGGFDIFRSDKVNGVWGKPINIGKPVNTAQDEKFYVLSADGKKAFYSDARTGGIGQQDIYVAEPGITGRPIALVQVSGVLTKDTVPVGGEIIVRSKVTHKEIFGRMRANAVSGKFLINLPAGEEYEMIFKTEGASDQVKEIYTTFVDSFVRLVVVADFFTSKYAGPKVNEEETVSDYEAARFNFDEFISLYGNAKADSLFFTVQLAAYKMPGNMNYTNLIGLPLVNKVTYADGVPRYVSGRFRTFSEATPAVLKVKKKAAKDAFIIAVYKGKRIAIEDLVKLGVLKN